MRPSLLYAAALVLFYICVLGVHKPAECHMILVVACIEDLGQSVVARRSGSLWTMSPRQYPSDYSHGESHFPESVSLVLDWEMDTERKRKLLWDNAVRFYARAPV